MSGSVLGGDNVYEIASKALTDAQAEVRRWRIKAEDAIKDLQAAVAREDELQERVAHLERLAEIQNQVMGQHDLAIAAYRNMVEEVSSGGWYGRMAEEVVRLQKKLKQALSCVPRGDGETFVFEDGDEAEYGSDTPYSEFQLDYFAQAHPLAMSCINQLHAKLGSDTITRETLIEVVKATKHGIQKIHERTQAGDEICVFSGKILRQSWRDEEDDDPSDPESLLV